MSFCDSVRLPELVGTKKLSVFTAVCLPGLVCPKNVSFSVCLLELVGSKKSLSVCLPELGNTNF